MSDGVVRRLDPLFRHPRRPNGPTTADRFWKYIDKEGPLSVECGTSCWVWTGSRSNGYGQMGVKLDGRNVPLRASIVSWALAHDGELPPIGMFVCHRCDNRACVRIDHLFLGTPKDNARDAQMKGLLSAFAPVPPPQPAWRKRRGRVGRGAGPLTDWLAVVGVTENALAKGLGVSRQAVNFWTTGVTTPSVEMAEAIEEFTFGAVPVSVWSRKDRASSSAAPDEVARMLAEIAQCKARVRELRAAIKGRGRVRMEAA